MMFTASLQLLSLTRLEHLRLHNVLYVALATFDGPTIAKQLPSG